MATEMVGVFMLKRRGILATPLVCAISLFFCVSLFAGTLQKVQILGDFEITGDLDDVVHLGDNREPGMFRPDPDGTEFTGRFDLPVYPATGTSFTVHIAHFQIENTEAPAQVFINGELVGSLALSEDGHWLSQVFTGSVRILDSTGNQVSVQANGSDGQYDDFEFTNLYVSYESEEEGQLKPQITVRGGYVKLDTTTGMPPSSDCSNKSHEGRMLYDSSLNTIYVCSDSGWESK